MAVTNEQLAGVAARPRVLRHHPTRRRGRLAPPPRARATILRDPHRPAAHADSAPRIPIAIGEQQRAPRGWRRSPKAYCPSAIKMRELPSVLSSALMGDADVFAAAAHAPRIAVIVRINSRASPLAPAPILAPCAIKVAVSITTVRPVANSRPGEPSIPDSPPIPSRSIHSGRRLMGAMQYAHYPSP